MPYGWDEKANGKYTKNVFSEFVFTFKEDKDGDLSKGTWVKQMAKMNTKRRYHSACAWKGRLYVAGGWDLPNHMLGSVEAYDPKINKWVVCPEMVRKRAIFNLLIVNDELYAIGGEVLTTNGISIEKRLANGKWELVTEIKELRTYCCCSVMNGKIYLLGEVSTHISTLELQQNPSISHTHTYRTHTHTHTQRQGAFWATRRLLECL